MADVEDQCVPMDTSPSVEASDAVATAKQLLTETETNQTTKEKGSGTSTGKQQATEIRLTAQGLNALIMEKLSSAFACDCDIDIVKLKDRILGVNQSKDKVAQKLITMQKQIEEVTKAVIENSEHMAAPTECPPAPLKFFRSVGLQVNTETRTQLSIQNANSRTKENTIPFKRNGILVGPASVKRNYASKMADGGQDAVPTKRPSTSGTADVIIDDKAGGKKPNGTVGTSTQVVNIGPDGQTRSVVFQTSPGSNVMLRPPAPGTRGSPVPRGTAIRSVGPRTGALTRPQVGTQQPVRNRFALPPLPPPSNHNSLPRQDGKDLPPRPELTLKSQPDGIVLSWTHPIGRNHAEISNYQIFACQESLHSNRGPVQWKRVGDVKALPLPMACTLSQFTDENRYHFIVRGVDAQNRTGPFCESASIVKKKGN